MANLKTGTIIEKVKLLEKTAGELRGLGDGRCGSFDYDPSKCPLKENHYSLSQELFGCGAWKWTCGFCGKVSQE